MRDPVIVRQELNRPNIYMSASRSMGVKRDFGRLAHILEIANTSSAIPKTIIFSQNKDNVHSVYEFLHSASLSKKSVSMYHASQSQETKAFIQRNFRSSDSELRYLSATIAFGMGIDIPDVEIVVVNGPPDSLAQLYQMYGRAGRNGCLARAHLLYTARQARQLKDTSLKCFASEASNENCRRKEMLISLGSSESVMSSARCCDICSGNVVPSSRLDVMVPTALRRPRKPRAVRYITSEMGDVLKQTLLEEREKLLEEFPGFKMIGRSFILSDKTIDELCKLSTSLSSVEDLNGIVTLRRELRSRIFSKIMDVISCAPSPKKKQRNN